jgi:hypothetical protein
MEDGMGWRMWGISAGAGVSIFMWWGVVEGLKALLSSAFG